MADRKELKKGSMKMDRLLSLNALNYNAIGDISVYTDRMTRTFDSNTNTYGPGDEITFELSVGQLMCLTSNSYISFKLQGSLTTAGDCTELGWDDTRGSAMNIFNKCSIYKDVLVENQERINLLNYHRDRWTHSFDDITLNSGQPEGYNRATANGRVNTLVERTYCIPLSKFFGLFSSKTVLVPGQLLDGSMIKFQLESANVALTAFAGGVLGSTGSGLSYTVTKPKLHLDLFMPNDTVRKVLQTKLSSNKNGLTLQFPSFWHKMSVMSSTNMYEKVGESVSHCLSSFTLVRDTANISNKDILSFNTNTMDDAAGNEHEWSYILGEVRYPERSISDATVGYMECQKTWKGNIGDSKRINGVSLGAYHGGLGQLSQQFERSHLSAGLTGQLLSGGRKLYLDLTTTSSANRNVDTFMKYIKAVHVYSDGTVRIRN